MSSYSAFCIRKVAYVCLSVLGIELNLGKILIFFLSCVFFFKGGEGGGGGGRVRESIWPGLSF